MVLFSFYSSQISFIHPVLSFLMSLHCRGTYYDPSNIFCGQYDCYKILGFDHLSWGSSPPDKKDLTQSYRTLSKRWHPDKNKDSGAEKRFMVRQTRLHEFYDLYDPYVRILYVIPYCGILHFFIILCLHIPFATTFHIHPIPTLLEYQQSLQSIN